MRTKTLQDMIGCEIVEVEATRVPGDPAASRQGYTSIDSIQLDNGWTLRFVCRETDWEPAVTMVVTTKRGRIIQ